MFHYYAKDEINNGESVALKKCIDYRDEEIHSHDFVEIVYIIDGEGTHYINGEKYPVKSGDLLYVNYGCTHAFSIRNKLVAYNLMIKMDYFSRNLIKEDNLFYMLSLTSFEKIQQELDKNSPLVSFTSGERNEIFSLFKNIEEELSEEKPARSILLDSYVSVLLVKIFRKVFLKVNKEELLIPQEIIDYIKEHANEKLTLKELAEKCFYNPAYFSRLFKKAFSVSFTDYIMELRLEHCRELLLQKDMTVDAAMEACGFSDRNSFYERFKNKYGCTPGEYRSKT